MPAINECTFLFRTSDLVDFNDDPGDDMQTNMQTDRQTECHTGMSCDSTHRFHKDHNETTVGGVCKYKTLSVFDEKKNEMEMLMSSRDTLH